MNVSTRVYKHPRLLFILVFVCLLMISPSVFAKEYKLTILHTNDHHGHFAKSSNYVGGLAAQATLVNIVRAQVTEAGGFDKRCRA